jgi:hypothetical protein
MYHGLFACIMDYLHVLCMILMVFSCVLCMTLMLFFYVYYGLFACINLVDVMPLFFMVSSFHLPILSKTDRFIGKTGQFISETGGILVFSVFIVTPSSPVRFSRIFPNFTDFFRILQKPTKSVRSDFPPSANFLNTGHRSLSNAVGRLDYSA